MEPLLVHPDPAPPVLAQALDLAGFPWKAAGSVEEGYPLPPETNDNLYTLTAEERMADGIELLPGSLSDAIATMESSELVAHTLGEHVFEWFIRNKKAEWQAYKSHVSQFELDRYLKRL